MGRLLMKMDNKTNIIKHEGQKKKFQNFMDQNVKAASFKDQMCDLVFELDILGERNLNKWNYNEHSNQTKMVNNEFIYLRLIGNKQPTF